jgi:SAM-dependent methyltransferase
MLDSWQKLLLIILLILVSSYLVVKFLDNVTDIETGSESEYFIHNINTTEGFKGTIEKEDTEAQKSKYEWLTNDDLFDDFYASVFTKLTKNEKLIQAETAICLEEFTKNTPKDQLNILDAGCGVGIGTVSFAKLGAGNVVGVDKSQAMLRYARSKILESTTLTETQRQNVEFRNADINVSTTAAAAEFTSACILYFTIYYFKDLDTLFRNLGLWVKPGGTLAIEVVNKYKFEPILDSANPWVGFSPQKYSKDRITKSNVTFDKFEYEATFDLDDPRAEFRETFRFKDNTVRRQKHQLYMPSINEIIEKAKAAGWNYTKYTDLTPLSFSYGYILFFQRSM